MDIVVRYWSDQRVSSHYLQSVLMGHCHAHDILEHFLIGIGDLELKRVTQVTMESPTVNWVFHKQLQSKIKLDFGCQMLDIGSCELHVVNGAFKHGSDASKYMPIPLQPTLLHFLGYFSHIRRPSNSFIPNSVQLGDSTHPS